MPRSPSSEQIRRADIRRCVGACGSDLQRTAAIASDLPRVSKAVRASSDSSATRSSPAQRPGRGKNLPTARAPLLRQNPRKNTQRYCGRPTRNRRSPRRAQGTAAVCTPQRERSLDPHGCGVPRRPSRWQAGAGRSLESILLLIVASADFERRRSFFGCPPLGFTSNANPPLAAQIGGAYKKTSAAALQLGTVQDRPSVELKGGT